MHFDQKNYDLRCEWGLQGVLALAPTSDAIVVVDILSFSTAVDIAVANGASVLPYRGRRDRARSFAKRKRALLASRRRALHAYTLSPSSLERIPQNTALVLPSANGSSISPSTGRTPTFTACLRNAAAVTRRLRQSASRISVIPAGERWPDNTLRPCLEDLIGAGAVLSELPGTLSPEAELAVGAFTRFRNSLYDALRGCGSGRELAARGFTRDIELAAEFGTSTAVPFFAKDRFVNGAPMPLG